MSRTGERLNGLRWRLQAMRRLWRADAEPEMSFLPPIPIPDPTSGQVEHPGFQHEFEDGTIGFTGWAAFTDAPTARVEGWFNDIPIGRARIALPRPDVDEVKNLPFADLSGFELTTDLSVLPPEQREGEGSMRIVATSLKGEELAFDPIPIVLSHREKDHHDPPPPPTPPQSGASDHLRVLVITHQLTLGGAQLYLLDLLRGLQEADALDLTVISAIDGPLRETLEGMGIDVHVTSVSPFEDIVSHLGRVEELTAWAAPLRFDVAFVNTATSAAFFGAEVAASLGIPAVWAIHESFPPALLWADLEPEVRERAEATVGKAAAAVFEADATRNMFEALIPSDRCLTLPYGVDFSPIAEVRDGFDRAAERRMEGIPEDAEILLCVGTVEPRKAQVPLAQAFELVAERHPHAHLVFVGGRKKDPHTILLEELIEDSPVGDRIQLIRITPDVQRWYGIADILVCASDIESLPRTVLEAMAWETPVLATRVFGLPDLIEDGETGWLCEARDLSDLVTGLDRALSVPAEKQRQIGRSSRALVESRHSLDQYSRTVADLLRRAADKERPDKPNVATG